jgi:4'-phosphopantetheinyl transferase
MERVDNAGMDVRATEWSEPPRHPRARAGTVDVWRGELEQNRSRAMLLDVLSRYGGGDPDELSLGRGAGGKPHLTGPHGSAPHEGDVRFNMSHSEEMTLVAVSKGREVGIDVEAIGRGRGGIDEVAIARRVLGEAAARRLEAMEGRERRVEFLRAWTRYEARVKCLGIGIGGAARKESEGEELWGVDLNVGEGAVAAVAVRGREGCEVRCWDWSAAPQASR